MLLQLRLGGWGAVNPLSRFTLLEEIRISEYSTALYAHNSHHSHVSVSVQTDLLQAHTIQCVPAEGPSGPKGENYDCCVHRRLLNIRLRKFLLLMYQ